MNLILGFLLLFQPPPVAPLTRAHAHNDYQHPRPLLDALSHGFCSVEADIFVTPEKTLLVGHSRSELKPERTLEKLYLEPLGQRIRQNQGSVYPGTGENKPPRFILLIDLKTDADSTYPVLHDLLARYQSMLTEVRDEKVVERAVTVVLSGSRPSLDTLARQSPRYAGYDGRWADLDSNVPSHLMPMISDNWTLKIGWNGNGSLPEKDRQKIAEFVEKAHAKGRLVRFWAVPEKENLWQLQYDQKVDLINTDRLADLKQFLLRQMKRP